MNIEGTVIDKDRSEFGPDLFPEDKNYSEFALRQVGDQPVFLRETCKQNKNVPTSFIRLIVRPDDKKSSIIFQI